MTITEIKITKLEYAESNIKGIVNIVLDNCVAVHGIRIIEGSDRLFVAMPSRKNEIGEYVDIIHPINRETREYFEKTILEEFDKVFVDAEKQYN